MSSLIDGVRRAARNYPGGVDAVALRLGKSPSTLEKELRGAPGYKLGYEDAHDIMLLCRDVGSEHGLDALNAQADSLGAVVTLLPESVDPGSCTGAFVAKLMREFSDVIASLGESLSDGVITPNEMRKIEGQWAEMIAAGQTVLRNLKARMRAAMARWSNGGGAE
ncbi:phage regulatory CII family protein [Comamonas odontotermitis]|uniref:phage regulatory CII family protein n=1 Tax=Comamonas odontotermitis TaxID=379895 RepID=UPI00375328BB